MPGQTPDPDTTTQPIRQVATRNTDQLQPDETVKKDEIAKATNASGEGRSRSSSPTGVHAFRVTPPPAENDPQTHAPLEIDDDEVPCSLYLDS
jgi:hypothetical protein